MSPAQTVSANIRRLRRARGWSQAECVIRFSEAIGEPPMSKAAWSAAEGGTTGRCRAWGANDLVAAAVMFGVKVGDLFDEVCSACEGDPFAGYTCNTCGATA